MKKCLYGIAALCLIGTGSAYAQQAEEEQVYTSGNLEYVVNQDDTITITGWRSFLQSTAETRIEIPEILDGKTVTAIGDYAFSNYFDGADYGDMEMEGRLFFEIPDTVTSIGVYAFSDIGFPMDLTIPASVVQIGEGAFTGNRSYGDNSVQVAQENTAYYVKDDALFDAAGTLLAYFGEINTYTVPEGTVRIGESAFARSGMDSITIPDSVDSIGEGAFLGCWLEEFSIPEMSSFYVDEGALIDRDRKTLLYYFNKKDQEIYEVPEGVTRIGRGAFYDRSGLTEVKMADTVTEIGASAFEECGGLEAFSFPDGVTEIGDKAFWGSRLREVYLPAQVAVVGRGAFSTDYLEAITVHEDNPVYYGMDGVLFDREGTLVVFPAAREGENYSVPEGTVRIGDNAFRESSLYSVSLPSSVREIGTGSFELSSIEEVSFSEGLLKIGDRAFLLCELLNADIPSSVTEIGAEAFMGRMETLQLREGLLKIGNVAFNMYYGAVSIPASVTEIGWLAFSYPMMESFSVSAENPRYRIQDGILIDTQKNVLMGYLDTASGNTEYIVPEGIEVIGEGAFLECCNLVSISLPDSLHSIEAGAFSGCESLAYMDIPASVSWIGSMAFGNCESLTRVTIPDGVNLLSSRLFEGCYKVEEIVLPDSITWIGDEAFSRCGQLKSVSGFPNLQELGRAAFSECYALEDIGSLGTIAEICEDTFDHCSSLKEILIPDTVTCIGDGALASCHSLENLILPEGLQTIGAESLSACLGLSAIEVPKYTTYIDDRAFIQNRLTNIYVHPDNPVYAQIDGVLFDKQRKMLHTYPAARTAESYVVPEGILQLGTCAFSYVEWLSDITIPSTAVEINTSAFSYCYSIKNINVDQGNPIYTSIDGVLFDQSTDTIVKYPPQKTEESYVIPDGTRKIAYGAFENYYLTQITIPASVEKIEFSRVNCSNLSKVIVTRDSYGREWAEEEGYTFEYMDADSWLYE